MIHRFFKFEERGAENIRTEVMAGVTTFATMAYILAVNSSLLSETGLDAGRVFTATALSAGIATLIMGLYANLPLALAPGMGLNAYFTYTVCLEMGLDWKLALTAVFAEGIVFLILTRSGLRESMIAGMPGSMNLAIVAGLGLFIAAVGLENAGIIESGSGFLQLGSNWLSRESLLALIGLIIMVILTKFKLKGALLLGILLTTLIGIPFGITVWAGGSIRPAMPYLFAFSLSDVMSHVPDFIIVVATLVITDLFGEVGTLKACLWGTGLVRRDGSIENCKRALYADAAGKTLGAVLGTSSLTTYVESASGVAAGGRTGFTAVVTAVLFFLSLFLSPLFLSIPAAATAPALFMVGVMMASPIGKINFKDLTEAVPAIVCILVMVFTFSIANGIAFGVVFYIVLKLISGRRNEITPIMWASFALVVLKLAAGQWGQVP